MLWGGWGERKRERAGGYPAGASAEERAYVCLNVSRPIWICLICRNRRLHSETRRNFCMSSFVDFLKTSLFAEV